MLDVGANRGQFRDQLRHDVGWDGLIVSVEPQPKLAAALRQRAASDPRWLVVERALGPAPGRATFNVTAGDVYSSFLEPDAPADFADRAASTVVDRVDVEGGPLDARVDARARDHGGRRPYLKLDTQGYDLQVLAGGRRALEAIYALQTELSFRALYRDMPGWVESVATLKDLGYEVSGFTPIEPRAQFPAAFELNGFFVRQRGTSTSAPSGGSSSSADHSRPIAGTASA